MDEDAVKKITDLLERSVPYESKATISEELKKDFVFSKKRSRQKKQRSARKGLLCRKERRDLCAARGKLPYQDAEVLHSLWCDYMRRLLELEDGVDPPKPGDRRWENFSQSVHRAELTGARLRVVRSKCSSLVDVSGVVVQETRNTVVVASPPDRLRTVPKRQVVMELQMGNLRFLLFGKHLCVRPAERSTRKVKNLALPDL